MRTIISPGKYIQAKGELTRLESHVSLLGNTAYAVTDSFIYEHYNEQISSSFEGKKTHLYLERFGGECSHNEINRIIADMKNKPSEVIIGIGGGKALDTAKAVGYYTHLPVVIIPTAASTDAPCSALSVIYTDDGEFEEYLFLKNNPDIVLADSEVIANAPVRFTVAGIGDALATYYEARACLRSGAKSMAGGTCGISAYSLASACRDTLFSEGYRAKLACEAKTVSQAVENIIEANIYLSGIGFESGGLAGAHAIHNGFTVLSECHHMLHGEKVAFGTLVQLVLENAPEDEIQAVLSFCRKVGLPTTLKELGIESSGQDQKKEKVMAAVKASCAENDTIHNMPFHVTPDDVYSAILVADQLGQ